MFFYWTAIILLTIDSYTEVILLKSKVLIIKGTCLIFLIYKRDCKELNKLEYNCDVKKIDFIMNTNNVKKIPNNMVVYPIH